MKIVGKVTVKKIFAYNYLYTQIKNDFDKFYKIQEQGPAILKQYIDILYLKLLNITNRNMLNGETIKNDLEVEVTIKEENNKRFILIEMLKAREIYGVTHICIILNNDSRDFRYFVKLNKLAYVDDIYGNLIEIILGINTKMITIVEDYNNEKLIQSLKKISGEEIPEIEVKLTANEEKENDIPKFDKDTLKAAKIFYINNWISNYEDGKIRIFDSCDTSDSNNINFFTKILNNKFFGYKNVVIDKSKQVIECKRCGISPCPINVCLNIMCDYSERENEIFNIENNNKEKPENIDEKLSFINEFDPLSLFIAEFLIKNELVNLINIENDKIVFKMAELEEEIKENERVSPIRIIRDFSEDVIEKSKKEININDIETIKIKYDDILENNPYFLSAYILYKMKEENISLSYISEKINSGSNIKKAERDFILRLNIQKINKLYLEEKSKLELIKMIEYAKKYEEAKVSTFIPFNMRIYADNDRIVKQILDILVDCFSYFNYITNKDRITKSFHSIYDTASIGKLYEDAKYAYIVLKEIDGLNNEEKITKERILNELEEKIKQNVNSTVTIIVDKTKEKIDDALSLNNIVKDKIFDYELITRDANENEVYQELIDKLEIDYQMDDDFKAALLKYISATYSKRSISYVEYIESTYERISFNKGKNNLLTEEAIPEYEKEKSIEDIFSELNELIGLDNIKQMLKDLTDLIEFKTKTEGVLKLKETNLHMVFLGNPGTGKTTVARLIAGILYNLKYIKQNKLIEVSAKDLVAKYVGQTAPKTMSVIEKALGGVLFVDEAYSLASKDGDESSFNAECIATLIQGMENYRDNLVVIFAGYKKEMQGFLDSNSGIVSRIGYTMYFEDYTTEELIEIFKSMAKKSGFEIEKTAIEKIKDIIIENKENENFGNARFVRNLFEKIVIKHATNTKGMTDIKDLKTITVKDISVESMFLG